jgi:hypothetical protein
MKLNCDLYKHLDVSINNDKNLDHKFFGADVKD